MRSPRKTRARLCRFAPQRTCSLGLSKSRGCVVPPERWRKSIDSDGVAYCNCWGTPSECVPQCSSFRRSFGHYGYWAVTLSASFQPHCTLYSRKQPPLNIWRLSCHNQSWQRRYISAWMNSSLNYADWWCLDGGPGLGDQKQKTKKSRNDKSFIFGPFSFVRRKGYRRLQTSRHNCLGQR